MASFMMVSIISLILLFIQVALGHIVPISDNATNTDFMTKTIVDVPFMNVKPTPTYALDMSLITKRADVPYVKEIVHPGSLSVTSGLHYMATRVPQSVTMSYGRDFWALTACDSLIRCDSTATATATLGPGFFGIAKISGLSGCFNPGETYENMACSGVFGKGTAPTTTPSPDPTADAPYYGAMTAYTCSHTLVSCSGTAVAPQVMSTKCPVLYQLSVTVTKDSM